MASIDRGLDLSGWSDDLRDMLKRRVSESGGVALIVLAALIAIALSTWSVQDPSFSHATDGPVRNFLGTPGAIGADLLMQLFGLASTVLVLPVAVWGWRIATHRPFDREWMRLSFWLAGTVFGAGFVACLPKSEHWPLPSGLGGVIGDAMLRLPALAMGAVTGTTLLATAVVFGLCTLAAVIVATGFGYHDPSDVKLDDRWAREAAGPEDNDEERTSISLGFLVHALLSFKARVMRLVTRRTKNKKQTPRQALRRVSSPPMTPEQRVAPKPVETEDEVEADDDEATTATTAASPSFRPPARPRRRNPPSDPAAAISFPIWRCWRCPNPPTSSRRARIRSRPAQHRSKACWATSASAARSSTRAPARW